jgi:hypothetical protein
MKGMKVQNLRGSLCACGASAQGAACGMSGIALSLSIMLSTPPRPTRVPERWSRSSVLFRDSPLVDVCLLIHASSLAEGVHAVDLALRSLFRPLLPRDTLC